MPTAAREGRVAATLGTEYWSVLEEKSVVSRSVYFGTIFVALRYNIIHRHYNNNNMNNGLYARLYTAASVRLLRGRRIMPGCAAVAWGQVAGRFHSVARASLSSVVATTART